MKVILRHSLKSFQMYITDHHQELIFRKAWEMNGHGRSLRLKRLWAGQHMSLISGLSNNPSCITFTHYKPSSITNTPCFNC